MRFRLFLACIFAILAAGAVHGQCVYNISTGWNNAVDQIADPLGNADDEYTVDDGSGAGPQPALDFPGNAFPVPPWLGNAASSVWAVPTADTNALPATFTYEIRFTLAAGPDIADYTILGNWAADDAGLDVIINGTSTGQTTTGGFGAYTLFNTDLGKGLFLEGVNVIQFLVSNGGADVNPTGLRVDACVFLPRAADREVDISTGFDQVVLVPFPDFVPDFDYVVTGPAGVGTIPSAVIDHTAFPVPPWLPPTRQSKWISIGNPGADGPPGNYTYAVKPVIADRFDAEVSELKGQFATDDTLGDIKVNGTSTGVSGGAGFGAYTQIPAGTGKGLFHSGENLVEFVVVNGGDANNPTGLRIDAEVVVGKRPPPNPECIYRISTAFDNDSELLISPLGDPDDEWTVDNNQGGGPVPATTFAGDRFPVPPWLANTDTSAWVSTTFDTNDVPGTYIYEIAFNISDTVDTSKLAIIGRWATDDGSAGWFINGTAVPEIIGGGFGAWSIFPPGAGNGLFTVGRNVIQGLVSNGGEAANPTGLRVDACVGLQTAEIRDFDLSTGFDEETLVILPNASSDDDFTVSGPGIAVRPATVINDNGFPIPPWVASSVQSKWVGAAANADGPPGIYIYGVHVNLDAGLEAGLTTISGKFAADDVLADVLINGQSTGYRGDGLGFDILNPLPDGLGRGLFITGDNTIEFLIENGGADSNPTGFRFDGQLTFCPVAPPFTLKNVTNFILDTGIEDVSGLAIADANPDDNYELIGPPPVCRDAAKVAVGIPAPPWLLNTAASKWISTADNGANIPPGDYTFRVKVDLPAGFDAANAGLIGRWSSDNNAKDIIINGISTGTVNNAQFVVWTDFPAGTGLGLFHTGENIVDFIVSNAPPGVNPGGLRVEAVVGTGTPDAADLSTGFSNRGVGLLPPGSSDDSYSFISGGAGAAKVVGTLGAGWVANSGASRWVGLDGTTSSGPSGDFTYEVLFSVGADQNPFRQAIEGSWAAASSGVDVLLNGTSLHLTSPGPGALTAFPARTGYGLMQSGINSLQFVVRNAAVGPTGLRVEARLGTVVEANPLDISTGFDEIAGVAISDADPLNLLPDDDYDVTTPLPDTADALVIGPGFAPIPPWIASSATSRWIGPANASAADPGVYSYRIQVTLTAEQAATARISGVWATDDHGDDVVVNDQSTGIQNNGGFGGFSAFPADAGLGLFVTGVNTIDFVVSNGGADVNPHGLRVDAVIQTGTVSVQRKFVRGDVDASGAIDISDPINNLTFQFLGAFTPTCKDALDDDDSGVIDISDPIFSLTRQFLGGPIWPAPNPDCGADPTADRDDQGNPSDLGCDTPHCQ